MDYKTAKKLKDSGFPQYGNFIQSPEYIKKLEEAIENQIYLKKDDNDLVCVPTLEELIEAFQSRYKYIDGLINDAQFVLRKTFIGGKEGYVAYLDGDWESNEIESKYRFTDTNADIAVANLWLSLYNK